MVYSNFQPIENTLNGTETITFNLKAIKLILVNQSATKQLRFKFNNTEDFGTLEPTEELVIEGIYQKKIILNAGSNTVPYRLWVFG